mmetsp:Transcript_34751/g.66351  ORF Transcript_34751/g.66351 Transcript_34751/m.66351 type:complete len:295 (-) Transcript_34751:455-1339(-)
MAKTRRCWSSIWICEAASGWHSRMARSTSTDTSLRWMAVFKSSGSIIAASGYTIRSLSTHARSCAVGILEVSATCTGRLRSASLHAHASGNRSSKRSTTASHAASCCLLCSAMRAASSSLSPTSSLGLGCRSPPPSSGPAAQAAAHATCRAVRPSAMDSCRDAGKESMRWVTCARPACARIALCSGITAASSVAESRSSPERGVVSLDLLITEPGSDAGGARRSAAESSGTGGEAAERSLLTASFCVSESCTATWRCAGRDAKVKELTDPPGVKAADADAKSAGLAFIAAALNI